MKNYITPINIAIFLWGLLLLAITFYQPEYTRYFLYLSVIVIIPIMIFNVIKQRKEDKVNGTKKFKLSIYNIMVTMVIMGILFFLIYTDYPSGY